MHLKDLLERVDPIAVTGDTDRYVSGVSQDSRQVAEDALFVAIAGLTVDGHDYVGRVPQAAVAVVERPVPVPTGVTRVQVADARLALARLSAAWFRDPSRETFLFGITGTNGKTTSTYIAEAIARAAGWTVGVIGTTGHRIDGREVATGFTTPEAPAWQGLLREMVDSGSRLVAAEVSSIALAARRVDETRFSAAAFTSLGRDHLDYHGDMAAYVAAKARLFSDLLAAGGTAVLAADDPAVPAAVAARQDVTTWTCGLTCGDLRLEDVAWSAAGTRGRLVTPHGSAPVQLPLAGRFNASNALVAVGGCLAAGLGLDDVVAGLAAVPVVPGRLEPVVVPGAPAVLVDYAHTPDALETVLTSLRELTPGRLIVVFGCGGDRDAGKRPLMGRVATRLADRVVATSDNPRSEDPSAILADIAPGLGPDAVVEADRGRAIALALADAGPDDVVLIAGKGHETTQTIGDRVRPFDDRAIARACLEAR